MMNRTLFAVVAVLGIFLSFFVGSAAAQTLDVASLTSTAQVSADTGFMLICAALVLLMTPGLAFFYGGFVRSFNILNTLIMTYLLMAIVGVTWVLWGYSLSFTPGNPFIGGLQWAFLHGVGSETTGYLNGTEPADLVSYAQTIPHQTFMIYQAMFAIITPALISGALVERLKFKAYVCFILLWSALIYYPMAHMVWAKGGLMGLNGGFGALDFAGGTVVHITSGFSAFIGAIVLRKRESYPHKLTPPHNVPFIMLGAGLLWFGWFGFNAGSAFAADSVAVSAFVATNCAAACGALIFILMEWFLTGKPTAVGLATGGIAGLVGITPAAGFVTPMSGLLIGGITAFVCFFAIRFKHQLGVDDALDTFPVHGVGGTIGALLTGIFATTAVNPDGANGLLYGEPEQLLKQFVSVVIAYAFAGIGSLIILKFLDAVMGLRVSSDIEAQGLDVAEHREPGYSEWLIQPESVSLQDGAKPSTE